MMCVSVEESKGVGKAHDKHMRSTCTHTHMHRAVLSQAQGTADQCTWASDTGSWCGSLEIPLHVSLLVVGPTCLLFWVPKECLGTWVACLALVHTGMNSQGQCWDARPQARLLAPVVWTALSCMGASSTVHALPAPVSCSRLVLLPAVPTKRGRWETPLSKILWESMKPAQQPEPCQISALGCWDWHLPRGHYSLTAGGPLSSSDLGFQTQQSRASTEISPRGEEFSGYVFPAPGHFTIPASILTTV